MEQEDYRHFACNTHTHKGSTPTTASKLTRRMPRPGHERKRVMQ